MSDADLGSLSQPLTVVPDPTMPPPSAQEGASVRLVFNEMQKEAEAVARTVDGAVAISRKERLAADEEPYASWLDRLWRNEPGYAADVIRESPRFVPIGGKNIPCSGIQGRMDERPDWELVSQRFGGGVFTVKIVAPDERIAGNTRTVGTKELELPGLPRVDDALLGSYAGMQNGYAPQILQGNGNGRSSVGDAAVSVAMKTMGDLVGASSQRADNGVEQAKAATQAAVAQVGASTDRLISMTGELADARAKAAAAERENQLLGQRMAELERRVNAPPPAPPPPSDTPRLIEALASVMKPASSSNGESHMAPTSLAMEELRRQVSDLRDSNRKELDDLRSAHNTEITRLRDDHRQALERARDDAKAREEDIRIRGREEVDRARDSEKNAARSEVAAKNVELTSAQNELTRVRADYTEVRAQLATVQAALSAKAEELAVTKAELRTRPTEPTSPLARLAEIKELQVAFGGEESGRRGRRSKDDDDAPAPDPWYVRLMESPMGQGLVGTVLGGLTGENEKTRRAHLAQQSIMAQVERTRLAANADIARSRAAVVTGAPPGARPAQPQGTPNFTPQGQQQPAQAPQQGAPVIAGMERGDPAFPPPAQGPKPLGKWEAFRPLLDQADKYVRSSAPPAAFLDAAKKLFALQGIQKPVNYMYDAIIKPYKSHTLFWADLKAGGAADAYPGLDHPAGQRWLRQLWALMPEAAQAEGAV